MISLKYRGRTLNVLELHEENARAKYCQDNNLCFITLEKLIDPTLVALNSNLNVMVEKKFTINLLQRCNSTPN